MNAPLHVMYQVIEQYIFEHRGVKVSVKPDLTSQRELFLLEYVYNYIIQNQGFTVHFT